MKLIAGDTTVCVTDVESFHQVRVELTACMLPIFQSVTDPEVCRVARTHHENFDKNHYSFVCIGIEKFNKPTNLYISISPNMIKVTKQQFYQKQKIYMGNPGAHISNTGQLFTELPQSAYRSKPYNPIELSE